MESDSKNQEPMILKSIDEQMEEEEQARKSTIQTQLQLSTNQSSGNSFASNSANSTPNNFREDDKNYTSSPFNPF